MTNWVHSYFEQNAEKSRLPVVSRSRYSLHLRRGGRRRLALITGAPMHYYSPASREWLPIDTRLQPLAEGSFGAPGLPFALGLDGTVAMNGHAHRHRTWRVGILQASNLELRARQSRGATPKATASFAVANTQAGFREAHRFGPAKLDGDRLVREAGALRHEIILYPGGLREELTLLEAPKMFGEPDAIFVMESLLPADGFPNGLIDEHTQENLRFPCGWARDAEGRSIPLIRWVSPDGRRLYSGVPGEWLAQASYPVVLDPDIDITGSTADGYIEGSSVSTSTTFDSSGVTISVGGRNVDGTPKVWRGYVKFNTSSLGPASMVERANLQMFPSEASNYVAWTIYVRQYNWSANDPMAAGTREAAWDGLAAAGNVASLATSVDPAGTPVISQDLPTSWVELEGNTYYGLWCNQEGYNYPANQGGQHQYSSANHTTPAQRPLLMVEYLGSYPLTGPVPLRVSLPGPRILLPDTRIILRSRARRTALSTSPLVIPRRR